MKIVHYISENKCRVIEGELRIKELNDFLDKLRLHKYIWICEDGSGIVTKIQLDSHTNQLVGLVLPFNSKTGIPIPFTYLATSAEEIKKLVDNEKSTHVYLVLAQSIVEGVPPFILQMFGTNNKFTAENVVNRWKHTEEKLKRCAILAFIEIYYIFY